MNTGLNKNNNYRILFVADGQAGRSDFERLIKQKRLPYDCTVVHELSEANGKINNKQFDAILMDCSSEDLRESSIDVIPNELPLLVLTGSNDKTTSKATSDRLCQTVIKDQDRNYLEVLPRLIENAITGPRLFKELAKARYQNEQLIDAVSTILIGLDSSCCITHWNKAAQQTFAIAPEDVLGKAFYECGIEWDWKRIANWITDCQRSSASHINETIRYTTPSHKTGWLKIKITALASPDSDSSGLLLLAEDTTTHRILERQLRESQKLRAIGQLAEGIAHEVDTPAQSIVVNTRFLQESFEKASLTIDKYQKMLWEVRSNNSDSVLAEKITRLIDHDSINSLLKKTRLTIEQSLEEIEQIIGIIQGMKNFLYPDAGEKIEIDINKAVENTIVVSRNHWKNVAEIRTDLDPDLPAVLSFPEAINHVILNLLINACEAVAQVAGSSLEKKGLITIRTCQYANWVHILISDTGPGIPEQVRDNIFDPFFTTKKLGKSNGQGLAICRSLIDRLGGMITFDSVVEKGTTFTVHLKADSNNTTSQSMHSELLAI